MSGPGKALLVIKIQYFANSVPVPRVPFQPFLPGKPGLGSSFPAHIGGTTEIPQKTVTPAFEVPLALDRPSVRTVVIGTVALGEHLLCVVCLSHSIPLSPTSA